jgi:hypothetical protein
VAPAAIPALSSAAVMTTRSITLSTAAPSATGVSYEVKATLPTGIDNGGGVFIEFCNSATGPLVGVSCTKPTGLSVAAVGVGSGGGTAADFDNVTNHNIIEWTDGGAVSAGGSIDVVFTGIVNPSTTSTFYARLVSYDAANMPGAGGTPDPFVSATSLGTYVDTGGIALSTSTTVGVTAFVLETMTFCTSHSAPTSNCGGTDSPSLTIGETISGGLTALNTASVSTGLDYLQLSTNAVSGATVNLKSNATSCGGLLLVGGTGCIPGQTSGTVVAGTAGFGIKLGSASSASGATNPSGTLVAASGSSYDTSNYVIDYVAGNATGVTSTYGSKFVDTSAAPVSNKNLPFTIGGTVSNTTPAGKYTANLNLIATGIF